MARSACQPVPPLCTPCRLQTTVIIDGGVGASCALCLRDGAKATRSPPPARAFLDESSGSDYLDEELILSASVTIDGEEHTDEVRVVVTDVSFDEPF